MRDTGSAPSQLQPVSLPSPVAVGTHGSRVEGGRTPKQSVPASPRGEQGSSHLTPAAPSRSKSPHWASPQAHHGHTLDHPCQTALLLLCNHLFIHSVSGLKIIKANCPTSCMKNTTQAASSCPQHVASAEHPFGKHPALSQETLGSDELTDPRADSSSDSSLLTAGNMSLISCLNCPNLSSSAHGAEGLNTWSASSQELMGI